MNVDLDDVISTLSLAQQCEQQTSAENGGWTQIDACPPATVDWSGYRIDSAVI